MESRTFYYARVSTKTQNIDRQLDEFRKVGASERDIISDVCSGTSLDRPGYSALRNYILRPGDTLVLSSLDRLSRSKSDIKKELQYFKENKIRVKVLDLPTTLIDVPDEMVWMVDMISSLAIEILGTFSEHEREQLRKRQADGIASAKARGKHLGRPKAIKPDNWDEVIAQWNRGEITAVEAMRRTGTKRSTFYKMAVTR